MEEQEQLKKLEIGTKEREGLKPAKVKIVGVTIKSKKNDGTEMKTPLAEIMCKHPDKEEPISLSKIKLERNSQLQLVSTWIQTDEEDGVQKIVKGSALADLMVFLNVPNIEELTGKEIEAVHQSKENHYLCIKAY